MKKRILIAVISLLIIVGIPSIVLASNITNATYSGTVRVSNNATSTLTSQIAVCNIATNNLVSGGYIQTDCSNTCIQSDTATDIAYMPSTDNTTPWCLWVPSISASTALNYKLYTGGSTNMTSKLRYFPGASGMTVSDNASIEIGGNGVIQVKGYINTATTGVNQYIVRKNTLNLRIYVSAAGTITADRQGVWTVSVAGVASGEHTVTFTASGGNLTLDVDGVSNTTAQTIIDTADNWEWFGNNVMPYVEYAKITVAGTLKGHWLWQIGGTFYDQSGNGNTGSPTFRTTATSGNLAAELLNYGPITEAEAIPSSLSDYGTMVPAAVDPGGTFTELTPGNLPGASFVNDMMAAGGTPNSLFWFPVGAIIICAIGLLIGKLTNLLWLQAVAMGVVTALLCTTIFPWFIVPVFGILAATAVVIERSYGI